MLIQATLLYYASQMLLFLPPQILGKTLHHQTCSDSDSLHGNTHFTAAAWD